MLGQARRRDAREYSYPVPVVLTLEPGLSHCSWTAGCWELPPLLARENVLCDLASSGSTPYVLWGGLPVTAGKTLNTCACVGHLCSWWPTACEGGGQAEPARALVTGVRPLGLPPPRRVHGDVASLRATLLSLCPQSSVWNTVFGSSARPHLALRAEAA